MCVYICVYICVCIYICVCVYIYVYRKTIWQKCLLFILLKLLIWIKHVTGIIYWLEYYLSFKDLFGICIDWFLFCLPELLKVTFLKETSYVYVYLSYLSFIYLLNDNLHWFNFHCLSTIFVICFVHIYYGNLSLSYSF